mmetsp:Transcript_21063/g.25290  ORF Transcript_21063/g.25290 Transcript_21063/m.25290 type:complete len:95 (+) Transcript_21063:88-372(+)
MVKDEVVKEIKLDRPISEALHVSFNGSMVMVSMKVTSSAFDLYRDGVSVKLDTFEWQWQGWLDAVQGLEVERSRKTDLSIPFRCGCSSVEESSC